MSLKIEISSLSVNRLKIGVPFEKYNIDVSIDEAENNESGIKLTYRFVLLSIPTNAKITLEGVISISGNENEVSKYLVPDERNIPQVVNLAYQELLPLLYVLTKSIDIPCPAYKISQISQTQTPPTTTEPKQIQEEPQSPATQEVSETATEPKEIKPAQTSPEQPPTQENSDVLDELEKLVEEQNVSSI
jgi:hypothetical protein